MRGKIAVGIMASLFSTGARQHVETFDGIDPVSSSFEWYHFVDRSELYTNSFRRHRGIVPAKQMRSAASLNLPEAYFKCEYFGSPLVSLAVEKPRFPLAEARWICSAMVICKEMCLLPEHTSTRSRLGPR